MGPFGLMSLIFRTAAGFTATRQPERSGPGGLQTADGYYLGERGGAGLGERQEDVGDLGQADGADPVPGPRSRLIGGGLHRVVHGPAGRGQRPVLADPAALDQPGARGAPLLVGPAADGLHEIAEMMSFAHRSTTASQPSMSAAASAAK